MDVECGHGNVLAPHSRGRRKARQAPVSSVPVSYMQTQHLRNYYERNNAGLNFSRQIIASCDVPGNCDIAAMNHALNAYLRRHDTFRSWFERTDDGEFIRHSISDPADIEFAPVTQGHMSVDEIRSHVIDIPSPLEWGCFTFESSRARTTSRSSLPWITYTGMPP